MTISAPELNLPRATNVTLSGDALSVDLSDGRSLSVPLSWYPRLLDATAAERCNWRMIGGGIGIQWPDIEEDLSVEGLIAGRPSQESSRSLERWLKQRKQ